MEFRPNLMAQKLIVHRARYFDAQVKRAWIKNNKSPLLLINLGGGLCSRFDRVKNMLCDSIHLDLPEVINLVKSTFPISANHLIEADLNQTKWVGDIKRLIKNDSVPIFTLEGVSMYLEKQAFLNIFRELTKYLDKGFFVCDFLHPFFVNKSFLVSDVSNVNADFTTGVASVDEILQVSSKLEINHYKFPMGISRLPQVFPFNLYQFATFSWGA